MLSLGHIIFSNCFPPHAGIVTGKTAFPFRLVEGIPSELNRLLHDGLIDVSPSSSIEFARNRDRYMILPGLSITSRKRVQSIILQSRVPITELGNKTVALTTASATSVVLLKVLLALRYNVHPNFIHFAQGMEDPFGHVDAALFIGDLAMKLKGSEGHPYLYDLGALWHEFTGLPFVFAFWQVNYNKAIDNDLCTLYTILMESKSYGLSHISELAMAHTQRFGIPAEVLVDYWTSFSYDFGAEEQKGLLAFYRYAAEIGVIEGGAELRFWEKK